MGTLILLRHGESSWNRQNRFTGWIDVSLSEHGIAEATTAGRQLRDWRFDAVFTSALLRAQDTAYEVLKHNRHCSHYLRVHDSGSEWYRHYDRQAGDRGELAVYVSEALNERYYGDLQGWDKTVAAERFGAEQVQQWRRSYRTPPPGGESLETTARRVMRYYHRRIAPRLRAGETVLVPAHGNSLRGLIMHLESLTPEQILAYELKTGAPHIYTLDDDLTLRDKRVLDPPSAEQPDGP